MRATIYEAPRAPAKAGETIVTSTCGHNCGGRCVVNAHVSDGRIVHISTDARRWNPDHPPLPACARGVGQIERTYHPDRLKYPMRRSGPRGSGLYERISWDDALDTVATEMLRIRDPDNHKFSTPSGKIEVYSSALAANPNPYGLGVIPPVPTWFAPNDDTRRFPLSLCTPKSRARTHSIHGNQPGLARVDPDTVWMHPEDAAARGIVDGQRVRVFNDIGTTVLPAQVTDRIAPGVVSIKEGAWYTPGVDGVDSKGCANVLTTDRAAPCGATTYNTNQVQIEPA